MELLGTRPNHANSNVSPPLAFWSGLLVALTACSSSSPPAQNGGVPGQSGPGDSAPSTTPGGGSDPGLGGDTQIIRIDGGARNGTTMDCNDIDVGFEKLIPTVLLLVDESGSMSTNKYPPGATDSRWRVLHDALVGDNGLVQMVTDDVRFGFMGYTGDGTAATCPILVSTQIFPMAKDDTALIAIRGVYPADRPNLPYKGETPTGAAIRAATRALQAFNEPGPKYILLATDGDPDTCAKPDPQCGQDEAVSAAQDAFAASIGTFVIGISDDAANWHLQQMANAGAGLEVPPPDPNFYNACPRDPAVTPKYAAAAPAQSAKFYKPADGAELAQALSAILNNARTCTFTLHGKVAAGKESLGTVKLDGVSLGYLAPDGWRLSDSQTLEILGASCDKIKTTSKLLQVSFPCDSVTFTR